jgi:hypothetical protein
MTENKSARCALRFVTNSTFDLSWNDRHSTSTRSALVLGRDISAAGARVESAEEIAPSTVVYIKAPVYKLAGNAHVRHCASRGPLYIIGMEFADEIKGSFELPANATMDYYEVLQINRNAEQETIHRVYRMMAARFHPDNQATGNADRFLLLSKAYEMLSDPVKRVAYDNVYSRREPEAMPIFDSHDFVDDAACEFNRRLGILGLLFIQRRNDPDKAGRSMLDLERLMGFPREYLAFTMWYLLEKGYVCRADHSDYAITANGIDYLEQNMSRNIILQKLLSSPVAGMETPPPSVPGRALDLAPAS